MADNFTSKDASNATITGAADEIGGVLYPRVKLTVGADGSATDVSTAAPLPVGDAGGSLTVDGTVTVQDGGGSITVDGPLTDTQLRATPVPVSGTFYQATQPVSGTVAVSNATFPVTDNGGSLTVDGTVAISGTVAVTDNSGSLTVDDGGSSLTVDGTVAATQSGTWNVGTVSTVTNVVHVDDNASTLSIDDGGGSITVDGTFWQATQPVSGTVTSDVQGVSTGAYPSDPRSNEPALAGGATSQLRVTSAGELVSRVQAQTDEGSFRDDFPGAALATALTGTVTLTNGQTTLTGSGTAFLTQLYRGKYVKLDADGETAWAAVHSVESNTAATLATTYAGTGGSGAASSSNWETATGSGAAISVGTSSVTIGSATANNAVTQISRAIDYPPIRATFYGVTLSQRIANQTASLGFQDAETSPGAYVRFEFTGTTNTAVNCVSRSSSAAADTRTTAVTLPAALTTAIAATYEVEVGNESVSFYVNGTRVAIHRDHIPDTYLPMNLTAGWVNGTGAGSNSNLIIDGVFVRNTGKLEVTSNFLGNPLPVDYFPADDLTLIGPSVAMSATTNAASLLLAGRAAAVAVEVTGTFTGTLAFEGSIDGATWFATNAMIPTTGVAVTTATAVGRWIVPTPGYRAFRVRCSVTGTGTAVPNMQASIGANTLLLPLPVGTNSVGNIGTVSTVTTCSTVTSVTAIGTSVTPGVSAGHLGKAEDAVAASGDTGVAVWGVRRDTPATNVNAAGDYAEIPVSGIGSVWTTPTPNTVGGLSIGRLISAASTNATSLKASAGQVFTIYASNVNAAVRYLKLYNKASAPTVGTDVPVATYAIPAGGALTVTTDGMGLAFATGIAYALTTGMADNDTGAVSATEHSVVIGYK